MKRGMFVTMFYVILDSKNRIISYASAGHNPMILYRYETNDTYFLNPKGFPVGISLPDVNLFRQSISLEKIKLKKDDMLLIYTDGVTEAMNERREQYGEDRLIQIIRQYGHLPPKEFISRLDHDIKEFTGGNPQNDDITVVAVKEKLTADEVLFGIRKKLLDMVELKGMSVKEACAKMKVSPATYYRYKKRLELMGERGLKNKVLRQDMDIKRVSIEERKDILEIIRHHPEYGAKRLTSEFNKSRNPSQALSERMVYDELRRLSLNTKELRLDYLKRNRLIDEERLRNSGKSSREMVEDLLQEFAEESKGQGPEFPTEQLPKTEDAAPTFDGGTEMDDTEGPAAASPIIRDEQGITIVQLEGHLDSVTCTTLEKQLRDAIARSSSKIILDLTDVSYISSGGWGIFVGEVRELREQGGDVVLVGMTPEVYDVYELLGFSDILRALGTIEEAVTYIKLPPEDRSAGVDFAGPEEPPAYDDEVSIDGVQGGGYVSDWESLHIEATTVGEKGDIAVLALNGIIDTISAGSLRQAIEHVIRTSIGNIVIDMSQVEYVSSGGWGTFTERLREVRRAGGDIKLFGMDPDVYYVFTMLGFNIVLSSFDILGEAIEDFKRGSQRRVEAQPPETSLALRDEGSELTEVADRAVREAPRAPGDSDAEAPGPQPRNGRLIHEKLEDIVVAKIHGVIEASTADTTSRDVDILLAYRPRLLLFDLSDVDYISSTGWKLLNTYHERCGAWGGFVSLCGMNAELHEIYRLLELSLLIRAFDTREAAIAAFGSVGGDSPSPESPPERESARQGTDPAEVAAAAGHGEFETSRAEDPIESGGPRADHPGEGLAEAGGLVDVDAAVDDERMLEDQDIRDMGWENYGDRLKALIEKKGKKEDS
jgi:anti-anti-sigma factor